ncbi:hypothetical protein IEQ34_013569 [Dendrobium chrysotoxum]|uniref:Uncharacterized protein n=1 Tax=Dendrobium chrysotoxum TaxID=161865 RepID=A0AAV7GRZ9_DENCH|nr:hypothetical protein IEQ34_013569 [Dendrobium chrysotoxum]
MSSRGGGRRGSRGGGGGDAHYGRDMQHQPSHGERGGRGRGRGGGAPPHYQERTRASDLPESSSSTLSRELEERLHISGSSGRQAPTPGTPSGTPVADPSVQASVATGTSLPPASSKALVHTPRPGFGTAGMKCKVRANHFVVRAADKNISQYEFKIHPEVKSRAIGRALMKKLTTQFGDSHLGQRMAAYDGCNIFYTAGSLPFSSKDFEIILSDRDGRDKTYRISIKFAKAFDLYSLKQFLRGEQRECPYDIIAALDVVLRESPSSNYVTISRSFYSPEFGSNNIGEGLECWKGYFQSLRPTQMGLSLNVDISATSFYKPVNLLDFVKEYLNIESIPRSLTEKQRLELQRALKGVRVEATHNQKICRRYKITGITSQSASQLMFTLDEQEGATKSVAQYFREKYNCILVYDSLPCIKAGSDSKPKYLPMEACKIVDGQRYIKKLNDRQVTQILRSTCKRPAEREQSILQLVRKNNYNIDKYAKDFGIVVEPNLTTVEARVLPTPRLKYHDSGREKMCQPSVGQWNMINKRMFVGGTVDAWACISFCRHNRDIVHNFCRDLVSMCNNIGMVFNQNPVDIYSRSPAQIENSLRELHRQSIEVLKRQNQKHKQLQLLIVVLPDVKGSYGRIKTICETELGLVTQCCQPKHVFKSNKQYLENLALKINVKAAGCNTVLEDAVYKRIPLISDAPTIIFGADVTHPAPGEDSSPSIAAVVASMDWPWVTKYRALVSAQLHRQEIIEDLFKIAADPQKGNVPGGMIRELLLAFFRETKHKPHRIIFYRDGVSDSQFNAVLLLEMEAIRKACASLEEGYLPPVTFIVVQKRHHTRLFPEVHGNRNTTDKSGNILPGTVVDKNICHPTEFDFYLCSHAGIQGTSRPAHYHALFDENNFSADGLQILTNNLCYTFARCTRSVSVVPPAYYAHLAAFRARCYMEGESESGSTQHRGVTRQRTAAISTLPAIKENVKDVMFYC